MEEAFHDNLSGEGSGEGAVLACGKQRNGKEGARTGNSQRRSEQLVSFLNLRNVRPSRPEECGGSQDQDRRIDEEGEGQSDG